MATSSRIGMWIAALLGCLIIASCVSDNTATPTIDPKLEAGDSALSAEPLARGASSFLAAETDTAHLSFDVVNEGEIEQLFGSDAWTFEATSDQILSIDIKSIDEDCRQDLTMNLVNPLGDRFRLGWIGNDGCEGWGPYEIDHTGQYAIEFVGGGGGETIINTTGDYSFVASIR